MVQTRSVCNRQTGGQTHNRIVIAYRPKDGIALRRNKPRVCVLFLFVTVNGSTVLIYISIRNK